MEIFNAVSEYYYAGTGNGEGVWDDLLSLGYRRWGIATDDCHNPNISGMFNKGWIHVFANSLTLENIVKEIKAGNFYSSTGATMTITVTVDKIYITTPSSSKIEWIIYGGVVTKTTTNATSDNYTPKANDNYVRVRITRNSDNTLAWSNPIFINTNTFL